jgi:hypothetical protein
MEQEFFLVKVNAAGNEYTAKMIVETDTWTSHQGFRFGYAKVGRRDFLLHFSFYSGAD